MSGPPKTPPAPLDARRLAETIDTIGLLVASLSDRVDAQGRLLRGRKGHRLEAKR